MLLEHAGGTLPDCLEKRANSNIWLLVLLLSGRDKLKRSITFAMAHTER